MQTKMRHWEVLLNAESDIGKCMLECDIGKCRLECDFGKCY
jgi:hypothetical protein